MSEKLTHKDADDWILIESKDFSEAEINSVERAVVFPSKFGKTVCFYLKSGCKTFIPLSDHSTLTCGETVDLRKAKLLRFRKKGECDITRVYV